MTKPAKSFVPANTLQGRRVAAQTGVTRIYHIGEIPKDILEWNVKLELERAEKLVARKLKKRDKKLGKQKVWS